MEKKQGWAEFRRRLSEPPEMTDTLIRHKWPEEEPKGFTWVLIRRMNIFGEPVKHVAWYTKDGEFYVSGFDDKFDDITHWWELPEV